MKEPETRYEFDLLSMGMDLGFYVISSLILDGKLKFGTSEWTAAKLAAGDMIEKRTGIPAEDLSLLLDDRIQELVNGLKDAGVKEDE